jgi:hypothetical protein
MKLLEYILNESMSEVILYHSTINNGDIKQFEKYSHFGTRKSAIQRLRSKSRYPRFRNKNNTYFIYKVSITGNFYKGTDASANDPYHINQELIEKYGDEYREWHRDNLLSKPVYDFLIEKGFDGITYNNLVEDKKSDSYLVFNTEKIKILKVEEFEKIPSK